LFAGSKLPEPFRDFDGSHTIVFALLVYLVALTALALWAFGGPFARGILRSRYKLTFLASVIIVVAYCILVSAALFGLSQSSDL
jgi:drug/metabolite transporter (DMT)-like permease